jgi:hypothetical protein
MLKWDLHNEHITYSEPLHRQAFDFPASWKYGQQDAQIFVFMLCPNFVVTSDFSVGVYPLSDCLNFQFLGIPCLIGGFILH